MREGNRSAWSLLFLFIIGAILLQVSISVITPLVPYMLGVVALTGAGLAGRAIYRRNRNW